MKGLTLDSIPYGHDQLLARLHACQGPPDSVEYEPRVTAIPVPVFLARRQLHREGLVHRIGHNRRAANLKASSLVCRRLRARAITQRERARHCAECA